jgi:hypothetical protein
MISGDVILEAGFCRKNHIMGWRQAGQPAYPASGLISAWIFYFCTIIRCEAGTGTKVLLAV